MKDVVAIAVAATLGVAGVAAAKTPTETVRYSFKGDRYGTEPYGPLIADGEGGFYGTTSGTYSKTKACGSVFQLSPPIGKYKTWFLQQLHVFARGEGDGCNPLGSLVADSIGRLYGTTAGGGAGGGGAVFGLFPTGSGWTEDQLYSFGVGTSPTNSLIRDANGVLYGTTSGGGATGNGSVFAATPAGAETTLYSFQSGVDGKGPTSTLVEDTLRHSFASVAGDLGYSESTIGAMLGHSAGSVTGRYTHHLDAVLIAAADRVAAEILRMMEG